jgi:hypothetical protein
VTRIGNLNQSLLQALIWQLHQGGSSYQTLTNQPTREGTPIHTKTSILVHHNMFILMIHTKNAMHISLD